MQNSHIDQQYKYPGQNGWALFDYFSYQLVSFLNMLGLPDLYRLVSEP